MLPPECSWRLDNGLICSQFAVRGERFCRFHLKAANLEVTERENRRICDAVASLDLQALISCLQDTIVDVLHHRISPFRQRLIYLAAHQRLQILLTEARLRDAADPRSPHYNEARFGPAQPSVPPRPRSAAPARPVQPPPVPTAPRRMARHNAPIPRPQTTVTMREMFGPDAGNIRPPAGFDMAEVVAGLVDLSRREPAR